MPTVKQFYYYQKGRDFLVPFAHDLALQGIVCYTTFCFRAVKELCFCLRKSDVIRFAHSDVAPDGRSDVMFAHCAEGTTSLP